ncbi:MAG: cobaltochelatase subunit CobN [Burkholderiaceae bacterium]|nr:cobaltochelatase subunit CobN [Burkholderiaceae bacterium]
MKILRILAPLATALALATVSNTPARAGSDASNGAPPSTSTATKTKVALLSTKMVLERKFRLLEEAARREDVALAWTQVDVEDEAGVARALEGAAFVLIDAPRTDDQALVERVAGARLRDAALPGVGIHVMSPPTRMRALHVEADEAQRVFEYYVAGMRENRERLFRYLRARSIAGDSAAQAEPPIALPAAGIYHPEHDAGVIETLPAYLDWWQRHFRRDWRDRPVIGIEISSSYLSDGQTRTVDETMRAIEAAGALPIAFYRASRVARARGDSARPSAQPSPPAGGDGFPNPKRIDPAVQDEPLVLLDGRPIVHVMLVHTFLGIDPDARKAWHRSLDVPAIPVLGYRNGSRDDYLADPAGVSRFELPFTLTNAEYAGLQDPVVLAANEGGELVPMPEQLDMLVGKALRLARLRAMRNADKRLALFYWNHPPGETNQGASNLNVPRSIEHLVERLRALGYAIDGTTEEALIEAGKAMLRPAYRPGTLDSLTKTVHWAFLPLADYERWYAALPDGVRARIGQAWGAPGQSAWIAERDGVRGFVIPRLDLGALVVLPQPMRAETAAGGDEKKLFHDTKMPPNHFYLATYLWVRERHRADAIVHFGTHGTQEWLPGKERGLWAHDDPNLLVGNVPVVYPYIVDNVAEAMHVKRRGRGVIVSHQTPPFAPAGLADETAALDALLREHDAVDEGPVRERLRERIVEAAREAGLLADLGMNEGASVDDFDRIARALRDHLEELGSAMQPLGLHTLGRDAPREHRVSNVMQMLGEPLYARTAPAGAAEAFRGDWRKLAESAPYRFVDEFVFDEARAPGSIDDPGLRELAARGREYREALHADGEIEAIVRALSARWVDPSYGGDPIRNPDALPTGRNVYGFDPSRIPTRAAWEAGVRAVDELIEAHRASHGSAPRKLAFTLWSTETMRHLGILEAQVLYALGMRPQWDAGGRVVGVEPIPLAQLGRPRIDTVISITGLYRDQFPNVMEWLSRAVVLAASLDEQPRDNPVRANVERVAATLLARGVDPQAAREFSLTRIFGNESGDYGTRVPEATLASDHWEEGDGRLERLYLSRMSWGYGPDPSRWSTKPRDGSGETVDAYAEHLRGTDAAVFSRSSNLRGLLDTDHPFEYLGGLSSAVRFLDGRSPQLYISNLRDAKRARLQNASTFLATELRSVYQHPNWIAQMRDEGYAGTLQLLNAVNNFWGWQAMDRDVVRDDQWQAFHEIYVKDRYRLGIREWFEQANPAALAQIAERMLEAIRKGYWQADEATERELVQAWREIAQRHDVHTANETFVAHVEKLAQGYGLDAMQAPAAPASQSPAQASKPAPAEAQDPAPIDDAAPEAPLERVRGQELREVPREQPADAPPAWTYAAWLALIVAAGATAQAFGAWRDRRLPLPPRPSPFALHPSPPQ